MSTAYHPQTDGETDQMNDVTELYLPSYCTYKQHDWASIMAMAQYGYGNPKHTSTKLSSNSANCGFKPRMN